MVCSKIGRLVVAAGCLLGGTAALAGQRTGESAVLDVRTLIDAGLDKSARLELASETVLEARIGRSGEVAGVAIVEEQFRVPLFTNSQIIETQAGSVRAGVSADVVVYRISGTGGQAYITTVNTTNEVVPINPTSGCVYTGDLRGPHGVRIGSTNVSIAGITDDDLDASLDQAFLLAQPFLPQDEEAMVANAVQGARLAPPGVLNANGYRACVAQCTATRERANEAAASALANCLSQAQYTFTTCLTACCIAAGSGPAAPAIYAACVLACGQVRAEQEQNCTTNYTTTVNLNFAVWNGCVTNCRLNFPPRPVNPGGFAQSNW